MDFTERKQELKQQFEEVKRELEKAQEAVTSFAAQLNFLNGAYQELERWEKEEEAKKKPTPKPEKKEVK